MSKLPPNKHIPKNLLLTDKVLAKAANVFGTPLYIYDASLLKYMWEQLRSILPQSIDIYYSVKANPNPSIIEKFHCFGASYEVASLGELTAVDKAGISPKDVIFVGPGKSRRELLEAIRKNIKIIVAESLREVNDIQKIANLENKTISVALRINPGRGKGLITMGGATQFGMEDETALNVLERHKNFKNIRFIGIHSYLGTGMLDYKMILDHTELILETASNIQDYSGNKFSFVDLGGGFGIPYFEKDRSPTWEKLFEPLNGLLRAYLEKHPWTKEVVIESGRFLVGPSGVFLARVVDIKKNGGKWFVILDGGINVFGGDDRYGGFRPTPLRVINNKSSELILQTLCGPLCTSADRLASDILLPFPKIGSVVAFYQAGAYRFSASPGLFLSHGFPQEVLYEDGHLQLIRDKLTYL